MVLVSAKSWGETNRRLEVSVNKVIAMHELEALDNLVTDELYLWLW